MASKDAPSEAAVRAATAADLQTLLSRPRRNRRAPAIREACTETWLAPSHFVYPLFIHAGVEDVPVASMPGCSRLSLTGLMAEVEGAVADGIGMVEVFPAVDDALKTAGAEEAWNPDGLVQKAIRLLKARWPELVVVTDVALDPYNADGHDGIVDGSSV
jgi:porphobilinogen synthase